MTSITTDDLSHRRPGRLTAETQLTLSLFIFAFLGVGLPRVFTATAADTLFITTYGAAFLPYSYIVQAVAVPILGHIYIKAEERFSLRTLILGSMVADVAMQLLLWSGVRFSAFPPIAFFGNMWAEAEFVFCSLWLWGMAGHLMTLRQGKRLFGYIGAGEPLAIIFAGMLTPSILKLIPTEFLFLLSGASVGVSVLLVMYIMGRFKSHAHATAGEEEEVAQSASARKWYRNRYIQVLVGIVIISQLAFYFTDNAFYLEAGARFPSEEELGSFIGRYTAVGGGLSLAISLFISGPLLKRFGLRSALMILPAILLLIAGLGSALGVVFDQLGGIFWVVVVMKTLDQSVRYSIDKTSSVTLYAPLAAGLRTVVQAASESFVEPMVGGAAGLTLIVLVQVLGFGPAGIMTIIFVIAMIWIFLVFVQDRHYQRALRGALLARRMGAGQLVVTDAAAIAVIMEALGSPEAGEALNGLALADRIENLDIVDCYRRLLDHPAPEVRHDVLRRIEALGPGGMAADEIAQRVKVETDPVLRAEALRTLATLQPERALDHLEPFLSAPERPMRRQAFVGLLRHGGIEGVLCAGEPLLAALRSDDPDERHFAASVLEGTHSPGFARVLTTLMADPEASVRTAALRAVGVAQTASMWPTAVRLLKDDIGEVSRTAAFILSTAGDAAISPLLELLDGADVQCGAKQLAARVLGEIATPMARRELIRRLELSDRKVAESVLFAIPAQSENPDEATSRRLMARLGNILRDAAQTTAWRAALTAAPLPGIDPVLHRALGDQIDDDLRSIFRLLTLIYPKAGLGDTWQNYRFGDPTRKAVALEALEVALRNEYRAPILAMIEHDTEAGRLQAMPPGIRPLLIDADKVPEVILNQTASLVTPWMRAASLYSALRLHGSKPPSVAGSPFLNEPLCRELMENQTKRDGMLTIEKVMVLRNTPIFSSVREEHLVDVAQRAEPVELEEGAVLFNQGDLGNSMFVVVDGRIRVYCGNYTIAELGPREVVGEMAAVDPEARSASVRAIDHCLLLRVSNKSMELLIDHDPDVARGIIKVLCARLRRAASDAANKRSTVN